VRIFGIALVFIFMSSMTMSQGVDLSPKGKRVILHADIELSNVQQVTLEKMSSESDFYGAISVDQSSRSARGMYYFTNVNTLKAAQNMTLQFCRAKSKQPDQCILLASIVPDNRPTNSALPTLSNSGLTALKRFLSEANQNPYGAFAASDLGSFGWVLKRETREQAETDALEICQKYLANDSSGQLSRKQRKSLFDLRNNPCRVLSVAKPKN
jgi:hypothetical protein